MVETQEHLDSQQQSQKQVSCIFKEHYGGDNDHVSNVDRVEVKLKPHVQVHRNAQERHTHY